MKLRNLFVPVLVVAFLLLPHAAHAQVPASQSQTLTYNVDGVERQAMVFVPDSAPPSGKVPVVFGFHWHGGTMAEDAQVFAFQKYWPEAVVVYMQGLPTKADTPADYGWQHELGVAGDRDLKFFDVVLASLRKQMPIDNQRIYAAGFSDGSQFSYFLWSQRPKVFAAFAITAGRIMNDTVKLTEPHPAYLVVGTKDPGYTNMRAVMDKVRELDGTKDSPGESCGTLAGVKGMGCTSYASTKNAPVNEYIHDNGHTYILPISPKFVEFFKAHAQAD
jgi:polyhydroxybutyrate depolymerase